MRVYAPANLVGQSASREVDLLPGTLRLLARGIVNGAFCWDRNGKIKPDWNLVRSIRLVRSYDCVAVVQLDVDDDGWLDASAAMGGRLEAPWAESFDGLLAACAETAATIRARSEPLRIGFGPIIRSTEDALAVAGLWTPVGTVEQESRTHYLSMFDRDAPRKCPEGFVADLPNVTAARRFLNALTANPKEPLTFADDLHLLTCCDRIVSG